MDDRGRHVHRGPQEGHDPGVGLQRVPERGRGRRRARCRPCSRSRPSPQPDDKSGEVVALFIVKKDAALTSRRVVAYCKREPAPLQGAQARPTSAPSCRRPTSARSCGARCGTSSSRTPPPDPGCGAGGLRDLLRIHGRPVSWRFARGMRLFEGMRDREHTRVLPGTCEERHPDRQAVDETPGHAGARISGNGGRARTAGHVPVVAVYEVAGPCGTAGDRDQRVQPSRGERRVDSLRTGEPPDSARASRDTRPDRVRRRVRPGGRVPGRTTASRRPPRAR